MSQKLYVGGLSWETDDNGLRKAFERFGDIEEAIVVKDRYTDKPRGFGFVTFRASDSAAEALEKMNGSELDGRSLKVNEARERGLHGGGGGRGDRGGGDRGGHRGW